MEAGSRRCGEIQINREVWAWFSPTPPPPPSLSMCSSWDPCTYTKLSSSVGLRHGRLLGALSLGFLPWPTAQGTAIFFFLTTACDHITIYCRDLEPVMAVCPAHLGLSAPRV